MTKSSDLPPANWTPADARPTMALRWHQRWREIPPMLATQPVYKYLVQHESYLVLQQAWVTPAGIVEWRDIPTEETPCPR